MSSETTENPTPVSSAETRECFGLVGIGLMGTAIAQRLRLAGFDVLGWDTRAGQRCGLEKLGGFAASDVQEVFEGCRRIVLCLPTDVVVANVVEIAAAQLQPGQSVIDTSTGDPQAARQLEQKLSGYQVDYLDATISGSSAQVQAGSAILLVGASDGAFAECYPILQAIAAKIFHVGAAGSGSQMKLVSNLVLGLNRAALAEGLAYAQSLGLSADRTLELLRESMAYSRIMDTKGGKMITRDFIPHAKLAQHAKDVQLMLNDAARYGLPLPLTSAHHSLLQQAIEMGLGELDNSAIVEVYRRRLSRGQP